jgi:hypothetical protein
MLICICVQLLLQLSIIACTGKFDSSLYNVEWLTPSTNATGSMPLGNGNVAANVWCEPQNSLFGLYIARQDAWDENAEILKLTRLAVSIDPPLLVPLIAFNQTFDLKTASVFITLQTRSANDENAMIISYSALFWIDAHSPNLYATVTAFASSANSATSSSNSHADSSSQQSGSAPPQPFPFSMKIQLQPWRLKPEPVTDNFRSWMCNNRTTQPDVVVEKINPTIFPPRLPILEFYHRNKKSEGVDDYFAWSMDHQGLSAAKKDVSNPLLNRQFGAVIFGADGSQFDRVSALVLASRAPNVTFNFAVLTHTNQTTSVVQWEKEIGAMVMRVSMHTARAKHVAYWNKFWGMKRFFCFCYCCYCCRVAVAFSCLFVSYESFCCCFCCFCCRCSCSCCSSCSCSCSCSCCCCCCCCCCCSYSLIFYIY